MMLQRPVFRSASTSMSVVFPAPEAPIRAVSTPGLNAPVMPCHIDRQTDYRNMLEAQTEMHKGTMMCCHMLHLFQVVS